MRLEYFQMVDRIAELDPASRTVRAECLVPEASPVFEGHFPSFPVMPGVLLLETMNHAAGYVMLGLNGWTRMPFFAGVKRIKIKRFVTPGMIMNVSADLLHEGSGFCKRWRLLRIGGVAGPEREGKKDEEGTHLTIFAGWRAAPFRHEPRSRECWPAAGVLRGGGRSRFRRWKKRSHRQRAGKEGFRLCAFSRS